MIEIKEVSANGSKRWDDFINSQPQGSPYHLYGWKTAVETAYGHKTHYYAAEENGEIIGTLPLVTFAIPLKGKSYCSLPFCDLGGVVAKNEAVERQLVEHAQKMLLGGSSAKMDLRSTAMDFAEEPVPGSKVRMLLALEESGEAQLKKFKSKLRSQVKKAAKNGVTFAFDNSLSSRAEFYKVMQQNMHNLGSPVHSSDWFNSVLDAYGANAKLGIVNYENTVVGGAIILLCGDTVTVPWASTLQQYNRYSPNMALYWGLLEFAADNGFKYFDFGRSTVGEGTYNFKKQWGAKPLPLNWQVYDKRGIVKLPPTQPGGSGLKEKVAALWQRMPIALANFLGPILRRYITL